MISTGALNVGPLAAVLSSGGTTSSISTRRNATTAAANNWSEIDTVSLLGGMITAEAVKSVARFTATKTKITLSTGDSAFTKLKIAGKSYPGTAAPNTVIDLPNIGTVTLNRVTKTKGFTDGAIAVTMLSVKITNPSGVGLPIGVPLPSVTLPVGTVINIAQASAGYDRQEPKAAVSGSAFGTLARDTVGGAFSNAIGRAALVTIGCEGTDGAVVTNTAKGENVQNAVILGHAKSTAQSGDRGGGTFARTTSTVSSLNILGGLIKGTNMRSVAQETLVKGALSSSIGDSGFDQLTVAGVPVPTNAPPNTGRSLPGLGKVIVNEQIAGAKPGEPTTVNGLHITISTPANALDIPVGTQLFVAHATVTVAPLTP